MEREATIQDMLSACHGAEVLVLLDGGEEARGRLRAHNDFLNLVLEEASLRRDSGSWESVGTIVLNGYRVSALVPGGL